MTPILIIFGLVLAGLLLVNVASRKSDEVEVKKNCEYHDWSWDHQGKMICNECNYRPEFNQ